MAMVALALYVGFIALGFGWRSWQHRRRTGSTGFRGVSGRPGSLEWWVGVGFVLAVVIGVAAPLLQMLGVLGPVEVLDASWIQAVGISLSLVGIGATIYAQNDMGESWRIGVDTGEATTLVRCGSFALVRNPIFTAMLVFAAGITLVTPNPLAITGLVLLATTIELQVRVVEEPYLLTVHGDRYRDYTRTVGRFLPRIRTRA
ncbi:methyltransferase family protein [Mycobacterium intracellulare]|uniref:methyltransferase family protein n=1 Tax=Mycobacterium intracellulare TaxID=1767 RepID=UPI0006CA913E|nr:isoprenylcysteine carboxylmethyltransferase family protein [Mycobacterium intracellulare]KPN44781.1 isoprenylcysteine carboxyl methyltransferase [Mycobacterium intracellulare subsp. chimaera]